MQPQFADALAAASREPLNKPPAQATDSDLSWRSGIPCAGAHLQGRLQAGMA